MIHEIETQVGKLYETDRETAKLHQGLVVVAEHNGSVILAEPRTAMMLKYGGA